MPKHDYVKFAKMLCDLTEHHQFDPDMSCFVKCLQKDIADIFADDDEQFNRTEFYQACEPKGGKRN
jgi:hypothetical protein